MKSTCAVVAAIVLVCLAIAAHADVFNMGPELTSLETVRVGNPGNPGELSGVGAGGWGPDRICGAVGYTYKIGKYEITAAQYTDFLTNKAQSDPYGLYNTNMWTKTRGCRIQRAGTSPNYTYSVAEEWANRPVNYVSYWDTCRFANWLHNGQGSGDTETGAYTLNGYNDVDGRDIQRNPGAKWFLPSEDEWYKAAYYKGGGIAAGYWVYPTQSNSIPSSALIDPDPGNNVTYNTDTDPVHYRTEVGEHENSESAYGTFDQAGNVWEWNEALVDPAYPAYRGLRGGNWDSTYDDLQGSGRGNYNYPTLENPGSGFRVAAYVPRPASGINNRSAYDPIISTASVELNFKVWGKVTLLGGDSFRLDDGSGTPVTVMAPGFSGIQDNDYACASGEFSGEGVNRVLNARAYDVLKLR